MHVLYRQFTDPVDYTLTLSQALLQATSGNIVEFFIFLYVGRKKSDDHSCSDGCLPQARDY